MKLLATDEIPGSALTQLCADLQHEFGVAAEQQRFFARSMDAPSWVRLIAELSWWQQALAASAALYVAELLKEAAKSTWQARAKGIAAVVTAGTAVGKLANLVGSLAAKLPSGTDVLMCIPEPDEYFGVQLRLQAAESEALQVEIALFAHYLPAVSALVAAHKEQGLRPATGYFLSLRPDASLQVRWFDSKTLQPNEVHVVLATPEA